MKILYPAIRLPTTVDRAKHVVLYDTESHITAGHAYYGISESNTVHETTHGINSVLRIKHEKPAFYCLDDIVYLLDNTKSTRITHALQFVNRDLAGDAYQHYMVEQRFPHPKFPGSLGWDDYPFYIFDEWSAYINGVECVVELIKSGNFVITADTYRPTLGKALQMAAYSAAVIAAIITYERGYEINQVVELWNFQYTRTLALLNVSNELKHRKLYDPAHNVYLDKFVKSSLSAYIAREKEVIREEPTKPSETINYGTNL